jgi:proteasome lid subunit RPN8/RPN11
VRAVALPEDLLSQMQAHAREAYPEECCGILIGRASDPSAESVRVIRGLERTRNEFRGERRRRFLIPPEELRDVERRLEPSGLAVVGFYHSHPDHPAKPSQFDQEHAWPWYSYLVLAVTARDIPATGAFELDPDSSTFREVPLRTVEPLAPVRPVVRG